MRIKCTNDATVSLKRPWMDEPVEFASTGTAQVPSDVGERLVAELDEIEPYDSDTPTDMTDDTTDTSTEVTNE